MIELNRIYNMDCLIGMRDIPDGSIDCVICDLPYSVLNKSNEKAWWDSIIPIDELFSEYWRILKYNGPVILFCQGMFTARLMMSESKTWRYNLIWQKDRPTGFLNANRMPMRSHEDIAVFYRSLPVYNPQMRQGFPSHSRGHKHGKPNGNVCYGSYRIEAYSKEFTTEKYPISVLHFAKEKELGMHPTQKPLELIRWLVRTYSNEGDVILDNCMVSGTTAVACMRESRSYIGFELNKEYYDMCCRRIEKERQHPQLF